MQTKYQCYLGSSLQRMKMVAAQAFLYYLIVALFAMTELHAQPASATKRAPQQQPLEALIVFPQSGAQKDAIVAMLEQPEEAAPSTDAITVKAPQAVAELAISAAQQLVQAVNNAWELIREGWSSLPQLPWKHIMSQSFGVVGLACITFISMFLLQIPAKIPLKALAAWSAWEGRKASTVRQYWAMILSTLLLVVTVLLATCIGWTAAAFNPTIFGTLKGSAGILLAAFAMVESVRCMLYLLVDFPDSRIHLLPFTDAECAYWRPRISFILSLAGYGLLFGSAYVSAVASPAAGIAWSLLVILSTALTQLGFIFSSRERVKQAILERAQSTSSSMVRFLWETLAKSWHLLATLYTLTFLVTGFYEPNRVLAIMSRATVLSLAALIAAAVLKRSARNMVTKLTTCSDIASEQQQLAAKSLRRLMPIGLTFWQTLLTVAAFALILHAWGAFDLFSWLSSDIGVAWLARITSIVVSMATTAVVWVIFLTWIDRLIQNHESASTLARKRTLLSLARSAAAIVLIGSLTGIILSALGVNIGPLLAGAGVAGLAIGVGAQKLVQDVINGVFIQCEDAIRQGDVVQIAGITGTVERVSLRAAFVRDLSGTFHVIPFSAVSTVSNLTRDYSCFVSEYSIAYKEDCDKAITCLHEAFQQLKEQPVYAQQLVGSLDVHGITALADSCVKLRISIRTFPGAQWAIGREFNKLVKKTLDAHHIEIPFPQMTVWMAHESQ